MSASNFRCEGVSPWYAVASSATAAYCIYAAPSAAGDRDLICNWLGNRRWVDQLDWQGKEGWSQADDKPWSVRGKQVGLVTSYDTLSFVKVFEAVRPNKR